MPQSPFIVSPQVDDSGLPQRHIQQFLTESEQKDIRALIKREELTLQTIVAEKQSLQRLLDRAVNEEDAQLRHLRRLKEAVAPISSIPEEMLTEIFQHVCLDSDSEKNWISQSKGIYCETYYGESWEGGGKIRFELLALKLSGVCKRWRRIATSTPSLWSSIQLGSRWGSFNSESHFALGKYLEFSGSAPMTIVLKPQQGERARHNQWPFNLAHRLISTSSRWKKLSMRVNKEPTPRWDSELSTQQLFSIRSEGEGFRLNRVQSVVRDPQQWETLEELTLENEDHEAASIFQVAPLLRSLTLISPNDINLQNFPRTQITNLVLEQANLNGLGFPRIISRFSALTHLTLTLCRYDPRPPGSVLANAPWALPQSIQFLRVVYRGNGNGSGTIRQSTNSFSVLPFILGSDPLPNLNCLDLSTPHESLDFPRPFPADALLSFVNPCRALTSLSLKEVLVTEEQLLQIFEAISPSLENLTFQDVDVYEDSNYSRSTAQAITDSLLACLDPSEFAQATSARPNSVATTKAPVLLLPKLTELDLSLRGDGFSDRALAQMVLSRCSKDVGVHAGKRRLKSVNLEVYERKFSPDVFFNIILPLRQQGRILLEISDEDGCMLTQELESRTAALMANRAEGGL